MNGLAKLVWVAAGMAAAPDHGANGRTSEPVDRPHPTSLGSGEPEAAFAMASGDFDGDGYDDLAVGSPAKGTVQLYRGTARGLVTWKLLDEADFVAFGATVGEAGRFGAALGAGRYFAHANPLVRDLIVGAPGAGAYVYKGDVATLYFTAPGRGTGFGAAVAIGELGGRPALAVGAPSAAMAFVRHPGDRAWTALEPTHAPQGSQFGAALSIDRVLAVGAPGCATVAGTVWTYDAMLAPTGTLVAPHSRPGDGFGTALAAGTVALDQDRLAIGAPDAGLIALYDRSTTPYTRTQIFDERSIPGLAHGARFGAALAIADHDLAIGAPGANAVGFVHDLVGWRSSAGPRSYGAAIAMGFFRNDPTAEVAVAAPNAGTVVTP